MTSQRLPLVSLAVAAVAAVLLAVPAAAHSQLLSADPVDGSVVQEGTVVTLTFNEDLIDIGTEIAVTDAAGLVTPLEATRPAPSQVAVTMPALAEGAATLAWRVVSADGHPIEGVLNYTAPAPAVPSPSSTPSASQSPQASAVAEPSASASASAEPLDMAAPAEAGEGPGVALWIAIGAAIAAALAFATATARRRNR